MFEDILTFSSTRIGNDIELLKNLQFGGRLTQVPRADDVQKLQVRGLFLLPQTFWVTLAKWVPQKRQILKVKILTLFWIYRRLILYLQMA